VKQLIYGGARPVIRQGPNILQASRSAVDGNAVQLTFWVNDKEVPTYYDKEMPFLSGYIGVFAHTADGSPAGTTAEFSSFSAYHS
jgi:hypothetical protein